MQYVKGSPALAEEIPMLPDRAFFDRLADAARKETLPRFRVGADVVNKEAAGFDPEVVRRVLHLVRISEFKRKQAAPVLKVTPRAFGTGWRMPIARGTWG